MKASIRFANIEDSETISNIYALSWKVAYKGLLPENYLYELKSNFWTSTFKDWIQNKKIKVKLVSLNDKVVGAIAYGISRDAKYPNQGEIISLYLHPDYYRRGLGSVLIHSAINDMLNDGYQSCFLWVLNENKSARTFYENHGFKCTHDLYPIEIMSKQFVDIRYVLNLVRV